MVEGRQLHQIASEVASIFFKAKDKWSAPYEPEDIAARQIKAIVRKGEKPNLPYSKALYHKFGEDPSFSDIYDEMAPHISSALDPSVIVAERSIRDQYAENITECFSYIRLLTDVPYGSKKEDADFKAIYKLLAGTSIYQKALRPKPEFRKRSYNFNRMNKKLRRQWFLLSLRRNLLSAF